MRRPDDDAERSRDESTIVIDPNASAEIVHELHALADRLGDLQQDLDPDLDPLEHDRDDEVWFDADALASASRVDLGADLGVIDPLGRAPSIEAIAATLGEPGISLATLPGWPDAGASGQGLGELAVEHIGELRPGDLVLVGGARGSGRTSLLAQLGDGLALAREPGRPATPVVFVSGCSPALWRARSLARYFGVDARVFVDAGHARAEPRLAAMLAEFAASPWAELDARQRFLGLDAFGSQQSTTVTALRRLTAELGAGSTAPVWPVVIVDPLDSFEALVQLTRLAADEGWIVLASGDLDHEPAQARAIDRHASVRLRVTAVEQRTLALDACHRRLGPRGRGQLEWHPASGRLGPVNASV